MGRILEADLIPVELWNNNKQLLVIPEALRSAFLGVVGRRNISSLLEQDIEDGPIGGGSREDTERHFVNRFDGSLARLQLALLDPANELDETSDTLLLRLSGGATCIADAPCGACAGALSSLVLVAVLRANGVLPRIPLDIKLLAADISAHAHGLGQEMMDAVLPFLEEQAITVCVDWVTWDVTCAMSNAQFVRQVVVTTNVCKGKLLLVTNFSGFLAMSGKTKAAEPQLTELFKFFSGVDSAAIWLEPTHNSATKQGGVVDWLIKIINEKWRWFAKLSEKLDRDNRGFTTQAQFLPLLRNGVAWVRLCVTPIDLGSGQ